MDNLSLIKRKFFVKLFGADIPRWKETTKTDPPWDERNKLIASFINQKSSVIDIGAGAQTLKKYLPEGCTYQRIDIIPSSNDIILANFNKKKIPSINSVYDVAICSGILEYILEPNFFFNTIKTWASTIILSYAIFELNSDMKKRIDNGWLNHYNSSELDKIFSDVNLSYRIRHVWNDQRIYELRKNSIQK